MAPKIDNNVCSTLTKPDQKEYCEKSVKDQCDGQAQALCSSLSPKDQKAQKKCIADLNDGKTLKNQTKRFSVDLKEIMKQKFRTSTLPECRSLVEDLIRYHVAPPPASSPLDDAIAKMKKKPAQRTVQPPPPPARPAADPLKDAISNIRLGRNAPPLVPIAPKKKAEPVKKKEPPKEDPFKSAISNFKNRKPQAPKPASPPVIVSPYQESKPADVKPVDKVKNTEVIIEIKKEVKKEIKDFFKNVGQPTAVTNEKQATADAKAKSDADAKVKADAEAKQRDEAGNRVAMIESAAISVTRPAVELKTSPRTIDDIDRNSQSQMNALVTNDINDDLVRGRINSLLASYPDLTVINWQDPKGRALARGLGIPELLPGERYHRWRVTPSLMSVRDNTQDDDRNIMNMHMHELVSLRNRRPDGQGMKFAGRTKVMIGNNSEAEYDNFEKVFHSGVKEAVVVVGDPLNEEAGALFEQLIEESAVRTDRIPYVWIPHTGMFDASATLTRLGIKRKAGDGRLAVFHVERQGDSWLAASHRPAGFRIMNVEKDYLNTTDAPLLLVIGAPDGTTGDSQTKRLAKALVAENLTGRVEFQLSVSYDNGTTGVVQRKAGDLVYISADDMPRIFKKSFERPVSKEKSFVNMFRTDPNRPQAYYFTGAKGKRRFFPVDVKELPGNVEPAKTQLAEAPQSGVTVLGDGRVINTPAGAAGEKKSEVKAESKVEWNRYVKHITTQKELKQVFRRLEETTDTEGVIVYGNPKEHEDIGRWLEGIAKGKESGQIKQRVWFVDTSDIDQGNIMTFMAGEKQKSGNPVIVMQDGSNFEAPSVLLCTRPKRGMTWECVQYKLP